MWKVEFRSAKLQNEVEAMIRSKVLTVEDRRIISAWIRQVSFHGPDSLQKDKKWQDHELFDKWSGYRSSSFSNRGRIIYKIEESIIKIFIERITVDHDYRRKK